MRRGFGRSIYRRLPSAGRSRGSSSFGPELLTNGGFETAGGGGADVFANWAETVGTGGALADETTLVHAGGHAAKLTRGAASYDTRLQYTLTGRTAGQRLMLEVWSRGDGSQAGAILLYDNNNGAVILNHTSTGVSGTDYKAAQWIFVVPVGCNTVLVRLECPAAAGTAYFDDVSVRLLGS